MRAVGHPVVQGERRSALRDASDDIAAASADDGDVSVYVGGIETDMSARCPEGDMALRLNRDSPALSYSLSRKIVRPPPRAIGKRYRNADLQGGASSR